MLNLYISIHTNQFIIFQSIPSMFNRLYSFLQTMIENLIIWTRDLAIQVLKRGRSVGDKTTI